MGKMVSSLTFPSWTNCVASKWISYYILHIRTSFQTAQNIMCYKHPSLFTHGGGLKPDSKNGPNLPILVSNNTYSKWHKKSMGTGSCKFSELFYSEAIAKNVNVISSNVHTISLCIVLKKKFTCKNIYSLPKTSVCRTQGEFSSQILGVSTAFGL